MCLGLYNTSGEITVTYEEYEADEQGQVMFLRFIFGGAAVSMAFFSGGSVITGTLPNHVPSFIPVMMMIAFIILAWEVFWKAFLVATVRGVWRGFKFLTTHRLNVRVVPKDDTAA